MNYKISHYSQSYIINGFTVVNLQELDTQIFTSHELKFVVKLLLSQRIENNMSNDSLSKVTAHCYISIKSEEEINL